MDSVSALSYSSSANLGPGFDVLAVSHNAFHDRITASVGPSTARGKVKIKGMKQPRNPLHNTAGLAVTRLVEDLGLNENITLRIEKGIPPGLGLGSSGASAAAAIHAVDSLLGLELTPEEKVRYSMMGEVASSGTPHADNVAACVFGGFVIVESLFPVRVRKISVHSTFSFLTVIPHLYLKDKTRVLRELIPRTVTLEKLIENTRSVAELTAGLISGDRELVKEGMNDVIVEEVRKPKYPFYESIRHVMEEGNAAGVCISGAGPSIMAVVDERTDVRTIIKKSRAILSGFGLECDIVRSSIAGGAYIG